MTESFAAGLAASAAASAATEAGLRRLAGAGVVGIILADFAGRVLDANAEFLQLLGYTRDDLDAGRLRWDELTPPEWRGVDEQIMRALEETGEAKPVEKEYVHRDGHRVPVLVGGALVSRETTETVAFVVDLTRQRRVEAEAAVREALFRHTFEQAAVGIAHVGPDGRWLRLNARLAEIVGYTRAELEARTFQDITHPDDLGADLGQVAALLRGEADRYAMDKRYVRKDGSTVWVRLTVSLVRRAGDGVGAPGAPGAPDYFISVVEDIDARKRAEDDQRLLLDLGARLALLADPDEIGRAAARTLGERLGLSRCFFCDVDPAREAYLIGAVAYDDGAHPPPAGELPVAAFGPHVAEDARAGRPTVVGDTRTDPRTRPYVAAAYGPQRVGAYVHVPLLRAGRWAAALLLDTAAPRAWSARDVALAREVAERAWAAVEHARLLAAERLARRRSERLQAVTAALSGALTFAAVGRAVLDHGAAGVGAQAGSLALLAPDGATLELTHTVGLPDDVARAWRAFPLDAPVPIADAVRRGEPVWLRTYDEHVARYPAMRQVPVTAVNPALVAVPLAVGGRAVGALTFTWAEPRVFDDPEELRFVESLAGQAALAVERARLYEAERAAREAAEQAAARVAFLAEASARLAGSLDVEATLRAVADLTVPALADWCFVELLEADGGVRAAAVVHADPARVALGREAMRRYPVDLDAPFGTGRVLRTGEPELVAEIPDAALAAVAQDAEHLALLRGVGFRSSLSVPLTAPGERRPDGAADDSAGRPFGVLSLVAAESARRYGPADLALAEEVARRVGAAIAGARLHAAERAALRRATALQQVAAALAGALTPLEVARVVVHHGRAAVGAAAGSLAVRSVDGATFETVVSEGYDADLARAYARFPVQPGRPLSDAVLGGRPGYLRSRAESEARYPEMAPVLRATGFEAYAALPVRVGGGPPNGPTGDPTVGGPTDGAPASEPAAAALSFSFAGAQAFDADERTFLETLAALAGQALERARLYAAERAARAEADVARARLVRVFEQAPVAVVVVRGRVAADLVYELVNPRYLEILPPGREPLGRRVRDVLPELSAEHLGVLQRVLDTGVPFLASDYAVPFDRDGDGVPEDYYFNFVYHPLVEADGAIAGVVGVGTEVTESVRARQAAERLHVEAEAARRTAEAANAAKSDFLAVMSHELRTPLNAIQGYVQLLEMELHGPVSAEQRRALARVDRAQRHLLGLINDVLNYARLESGKVEYDVRPVVVADVLADVAPMVEPQLAAKALAYGVRPPASATVPVWADREKLAQVLLNLLSNAVKFTEPGGRVTVAWGEDARAPERLLLHVTDTGIGIPPGKLDAVFEPFVQLQTGYTRRQEGTGLGLAISRDLARGMGGDLTAASEPGRGSTFTVALRRVVATDGTPVDRRAREERRLAEERRADEDRREATGGEPPDRAR